MRRITSPLVPALVSLILAILNHPALAQPPSDDAPQSIASSTSNAPIAGYSDFEIVESAPIETSLDHPDIRNAEEVWLEMIRGAQRSLDFAEFYASDDPADSNDAIDRIVREIEAAAARGVKVRFLTSSSFYKTYPQIVDRLRFSIGNGAAPGCSDDGLGPLLIDYNKIAGGVLHAKYFIVDSREVYLGSQNFDWRALEHIQELGVRYRVMPSNEHTSQLIQNVFLHDWRSARQQAGADTCRMKHVFIRPSDVHDEIETEAGLARFTPIASPRGQPTVDSLLWDEPRIVRLIDDASTSVSVQLLTYKPVSGGEYYDALEGALRRAAARGVQVRLLVADWCKRPTTIPYLKSLTLVPNVQVRMMTIPEWSGGFIPFARVIHAKYMVVDGRAAWIGTSNWERDYFYESRNVGVIVESTKIGGILTRFFDGNWESEYAYAVDPAVEYAVPRIGE